MPCQAVIARESRSGLLLRGRRERSAQGSEQDQSAPCALQNARTHAGRDEPEREEIASSQAPFVGVIQLIPLLRLGLCLIPSNPIGIL
jgi:hypothetical protein